MRRRIERKGWNWSPVPAEVILSPKLSHADVRVYAYLLWRAGNKESAWPSADTVAKDLSMSNASVRLSYRNLISENWIRRLRRVGHSSMTYIFETQKDCLDFSPSANLLADEQLTGKPTNSLPVSRVNESHLNENQPNESQRACAPKNGAHDELSGLDQLFSELTGLEIPDPHTEKERKAEGAAWYQPMRRMLRSGNSQATEVLRLAIERLQHNHMTIADPRSIERTFKAILAELRKGVNQSNEPAGFAAIREFRKEHGLDGNL